MTKENEVSVVVPEELKNIDGISPQQAYDGILKLLDVAKEYSVSKRKIAKYEAMENVMITEIKSKYSFYHKLLDKVFSDRKTIINKHFELIDKGMKENKDNLIDKGLAGLSNVVATSPFADIKNFHQMLESGQKIEL